jgi:photosystem II stability/assembly factor-like uncharacterized protein
LAPERDIEQRFAIAVRFALAELPARASAAPASAPADGALSAGTGSVKAAVDEAPFAETAPAALAARAGAVAAGLTSLAADTPAVAPVATKTRKRRRAVLVASAGHSAFWVLQDSGAVLHSTDRKNWVRQATGIESDLLAGAAPSSTVCWAVGREGTILLTTDGIHWTRVPSPTTADLVGVIAIGAEVATIVAKDGQRHSTMDGGRNWQPREGAAGAWQRLGSNRRLIILGERAGLSPRNSLRR